MNRASSPKISRIFASVSRSCPTSLIPRPSFTPEGIVLRPQGFHHAGIKGTDFLGRIARDENPVIFEHDDFGNPAELGLVLIDPALQFHAQSITGIDILDPKGIREKSFCSRPRHPSASHSVDQQSMGMNDELGFENIVQGGLHRGSTGIVADRLAHEVLDQLLPGMRLGRGLHAVELVDLDPVEGNEGLLVQARQRCARGFHPKDFLVLAGGIPLPHPLLTRAFRIHAKVRRLFLNLPLLDI